VSVSQAIEGALDQFGTPDTDEGFVRASEHPCQGAQFHSPRPLLTRPREGVYLCPTCDANLRVLLHLLDSTENGLEWIVQREFGNQLRALGKQIAGVTQDG